MLLTKRPSKKMQFNNVLKISVQITQSPYFKLINQKYKVYVYIVIQISDNKNVWQWQPSCYVYTFFIFMMTSHGMPVKTIFFYLLLFAIWNFIPSSHEQIFKPNFLKRNKNMKQRESSAISNKKNHVLTLSAFYKQTKPKKKNCLSTSILLMASSSVKKYRLNCMILPWPTFSI